MSQCQIHNQEFVLKPAGVSKRTGKPYSAFYACPTFGCTQRPPKPESFYPPKAATNYAPKERNWDREAYEKCCSIWAAQLQVEAAIEQIKNGDYWNLFQAIRADGEKRFATGMDKARAIFAKPVEEAGDEAPWPTEEM